MIQPNTGSELTFWCTRHQHDEPVSNAPLESQRRGVLWVDRCDVPEDFPDAKTPNEPPEALEPIYESLSRMGRELAMLRKRLGTVKVTTTGFRGATDAES